MGYAIAVLVTSLATLISLPLRHYLDHSNLVMIYLFGLVFVASKFGRGPSILAAVISVLAFDFFCIQPYYEFAISDSEFLITFFCMLMIAMLISALTTQVKAQAETALAQEKRTSALHKLSHELSVTRGRENILEVALRNVRTVFNALVAVHMPDSDGRLYEYTADDKLQKIDREENEIAAWVFKNKLPAGREHEQFSTSGSVFIPLEGSQGVVGVLQASYRDGSRAFTKAEVDFLKAFAYHTAVCLEVAIFTEQTRQKELQAARAASSSNPFENA